MRLLSAPLSASAPLQAPPGLGAPPPDVIIGTGGADALQGTIGDDTIKGLGGNDYLDGGSGDDLLVGGKGEDNLLGDDGTDRLQGGADRDYLEGGSGDDLLLGGSGDDQFAGGLGDDRMVGGGGVDTALYVFTGATHFDGSQLGLAPETKVVDEFGSTDTLIGVEGFSLRGSEEADTLIGSRGKDYIGTWGGNGDLVDGGDGDDSLTFRGAGSATINAGAGADLLWLQDSPDYWGEVAEAHATMDGGDGVDRVVLSLFNATSNETVRFIGDHLTASTADGVLEVDATKVESLSITCGLGDDTVTGSAADDLIYASVRGGDDGEDVLDGRGGDDSIEGGGGDDMLTGGAGRDTMTGGDGADTFVYDRIGDSSKAARADLITDLSSGDHIDLSAIDADVHAAGDQAFHLVSGFSHTAGELMLTHPKGGDVTLLRGDVDGDGRADFVVELSGDQRDFHAFVF